MMKVIIKLWVSGVKLVCRVQNVIVTYLVSVED